MARNYYAEAISILLDSNADFKSIVVEIAKTHPSLVVKNCHLFSWENEAKRLYDSGEKVLAIRHCRDHTGMGLAEAKAAVERL